jgi:hypothetical protein
VLKCAVEALSSILLPGWRDLELASLLGQGCVTACKLVDLLVEATQGPCECVQLELALETQLLKTISRVLRTGGEQLYGSGQCGVLWKYSPRGLRPWQRRYFVLEGHYLKYYSNEDRTDQRGRVDLRSVKQVVACPEALRVFKLHINISTRSGGGTRLMQLRVGKATSEEGADGEAERREWVDAIREVMQAGMGSSRRAKRGSQAAPGGAVQRFGSRGSIAESVAAQGGWVRRMLLPLTPSAPAAAARAPLMDPTVSNGFAEDGEEAEGGWKETELEKLQCLLLVLLQALVERRGTTVHGAQRADPVFDRLIAVVHIESLQELLAPPSPPEMDDLEADKQMAALEEYQKEKDKPLRRLQVRGLLMVQSLKAYDPALQWVVEGEEDQVDSYIRKKTDEEVQSVEIVWKDSGVSMAADAPGDAATAAGGGTEQQLERRQFHIPEVCHLLSKETRDELVENITRESYEKTMQAFTVQAKEILADIRHLQWLKVHLPNLAHTVLNRSAQYKITWLTFCVNLLINLAYASNLHHDEHGEITVMSAPGAGGAFIRDGGAFVDKISFQKLGNWTQCVLASLTVLLYLTVRAPVAYRLAANAAQQQRQARLATAAANGPPPASLSGTVAAAAGFVLRPLLLALEACGVTVSTPQLAGLWAALTNFFSIYYILYLVFAIYAMTYPWLSSLLLFDIGMNTLSSPLLPACSSHCTIPYAVRPSLHPPARPPARPCQSSSCQWRIQCCRPSTSHGSRSCRPSSSGSSPCSPSPSSYSRSRGTTCRTTTARSCRRACRSQSASGCAAAAASETTWTDGRTGSTRLAGATCWTSCSSCSC